MSDVTQRKTAAGDNAAKQALTDRYHRWQASRGEDPRRHVNYMNFQPDEGDPKSAAHRMAAMFDDDESEWTV